jgi:hypothetical protein
VRQVAIKQVTVNSAVGTHSPSDPRCLRMSGMQKDTTNQLERLLYGASLNPWLSQFSMAHWSLNEFACSNYCS